MLFIDGKDINTIPLKTLRENIGYVPQDNFLFSDTLKSISHLALKIGYGSYPVRNTRCLHP